MAKDPADGKGYDKGQRGAHAKGQGKDSKGVESDPSYKGDHRKGGKGK